MTDKEKIAELEARVTWLEGHFEILVDLVNHGGALTEMQFANLTGRVGKLEGGAAGDKRGDH